MISQSIPQVFASAITDYRGVLSPCCTISVWLTLVVLLATALMLRITAQNCWQLRHATLSHQQTSLADVNGYIEEMMNGQKVVKVFCHEEKAMEEFQSPAMTSCATMLPSANSYANILMPGK